MPIKRSGLGLPITPRPRPPSRARLALWALVDFAALVFGVLAMAFVGLILFGTDAQIAAWGRWVRALVGA
jgi:hypothetical protein